MADKQKKENFFKRTGKKIVTYAKATKSELKKVSWPAPKQLFNNTVIVIFCIIAVGLVIFILDSIFGLGFNFLNNKKLEEPKEDTAVEAVTEGLDSDEDYSDIAEDVVEGTQEFTENASE